MIKRLLPMSLIVLAAFTSSCSKEKGCTDNAALNYSATAEEDDGTCILPTVANRIIGSWTGTVTISEYYLLDASEDSNDITLTFNEDGTGTRVEEGTTANFTWEVKLSEDTLVQNDKIIITENGEEMSFDIYTDTATEQKWEHLTSEMVGGNEKIISVLIKVTK